MGIFTKIHPDIREKRVQLFAALIKFSFHMNRLVSSIPWHINTYRWKYKSNYNDFVKQILNKCEQIKINAKKCDKNFIKLLELPSKINNNLMEELLNDFNNIIFILDNFHTIEWKKIEDFLDFMIYLDESLISINEILKKY